VSLPRSEQQKSVVWGRGGLSGYKVQGSGAPVEGVVEKMQSIPGRRENLAVRFRFRIKEAVTGKTGSTIGEKGGRDAEGGRCVVCGLGGVDGERAERYCKLEREEGGESWLVVAMGYLRGKAHLMKLMPSS